MSIEPREVLRAMFDAAMEAASPSLRVPAHLPHPPKGRTVVIGAGKASALMARAVEQNWPGSLTGLVVTRDGHSVPCSRTEIVEASHPVPDVREALGDQVIAGPTRTNVNDFRAIVVTAQEKGAAARS
jgi:glycerate 2-kinase